MYRTWRREEWGRTCILILMIAKTYGEFHSDYITGQQISERNIIGSAVNALVRQGYLTSTGEHRKGRSSASHGRRSYVYKLTWRGKQLAHAIPNEAPPPPEAGITLKLF